MAGIGRDPGAPALEEDVAAERSARRLPQAAARSRIVEGAVDSVFIGAGKATALLRVAARRAAGFFRANKRTGIVWFEGGNELAVGFAGVDAKSGDGGSPCGANRGDRQLQRGHQKIISL